MFYTLGVHYVTHSQINSSEVLQFQYKIRNSSNDSVTWMRSQWVLPAVKLNVLPFGEAWNGENQFSTEPTTGICRSSPCKAHEQTLAGERATHVVTRYFKAPALLMFTALPLPEAVLHLLSEAEVGLPESLF